MAPWPPRRFVFECWNGGRDVSPAPRAVGQDRELIYRRNRWRPKRIRPVEDKTVTQTLDEGSLSSTPLLLAASWGVVAQAHRWGRAGREHMDLRDHETEGHSRRVTEMAMRLARAIGISEVELVHMRRGALLHDIGKLGVPDAILNKPGPLTEGEHFVIPGDRPVVVCADVLDLSASRGQESVSSVE
jgi:putative nucleotidyltransferase with HDIG domain